MTHRASGSQRPEPRAEDFRRGDDPTASRGGPPLPPGYSAPGESEPAWLDDAAAPSAGDPPTTEPEYVSFEAPLKEKAGAEGDRPAGRLAALQRSRASEIAAPRWSLGSLLLALLGWSLAASVIAWIVLLVVTEQAPGM